MQSIEPPFSIVNSFVIELENDPSSFQEAVIILVITADRIRAGSENEIVNDHDVTRMSDAFFRGASSNRHPTSFPGFSRRFFSRYLGKTLGTRLKNPFTAGIKQSQVCTPSGALYIKPKVRVLIVVNLLSFGEELATLCRYARPYILASGKIAYLVPENDSKPINVCNFQSLHDLFKRVQLIKLGCQ